MQRRYGTIFVGLRLSNILYDLPGHYAGYDRLPLYWQDSAIRRETLWKYVDSRDVADAVLCSLTAELDESEVFNISAADTVMDVPTRDLFAAHFPGVEVADIGTYDTPVSLAKAAQLLGWAPARSWRDVLRH
jgi:nucleoside-diphosphate-sugar epimerase